MKIKECYDTEGWYDRYTIVFKDSRPNPDPNNPHRRLYMCLGMNDTPENPSFGISQFGECILGKHLGKKIAFNDLPDNIQIHVNRRMLE